MNYKNQDDPLKYLVHEGVFEKGALKYKVVYRK